jgi:hypothetical protein
MFLFGRRWLRERGTREERGIIERVSSRAQNLCRGSMAHGQKGERI